VVSSAYKWQGSLHDLKLGVAGAALGAFSFGYFVGNRLHGNGGAAGERLQAGSETGSDRTDESILGPSAAELVSLIGDGVISTFADGRIILFNKSAEDLFGYLHDEVIGHPVEMLLPARFRQTHRRDVLTFAGISTPERRTMGDRREVFGQHKNGQEFLIEASLSRQFVKGTTILTVVIRDVSERKRLEELRRLLASESAHRFKNILTVVSSIVSLTTRGAGSVDAFAQSLQVRLEALARAQDVLLHKGEDGADLRQLIQSELSPYLGRTAGRISIDGPPVTLASQTAIKLALVIHELATNAAKYGALSTSDGKTSVRWSLEGEADKKRLLLSWTELGGPAVIAPTQRGFGTELIERSLGRETRLTFEPAGLHAHFTISLAGA
jgi:PAS domain S-box-containing protein